MIIHQRVKNFETLGLGMFVHFGIYSLLQRGEWIRDFEKMPKEEYEPLHLRFNPKPTWAKELAAAAKDAGCRYITLTSRHHGVELRRQLYVASRIKNMIKDLKVDIPHIRANLYGAIKRNIEEWKKPE